MTSSFPYPLDCFCYGAELLFYLSLHLEFYFALGGLNRNCSLLVNDLVNIFMRLRFLVVIDTLIVSSISLASMNRHLPVLQLVLLCTARLF